MNPKTLAIPLMLMLLALAACRRGGEEAPVPAAASTTSESPAAAPESPAGAPVGPLSSRGEPVRDSPAASAGQESALQFDIPGNWEQSAPATAMRVAQATIPGPGGPADFVVFYFGPGGGGPVEANIQRWIDQMEPDPGSDPTPETFESGGYHVTWIDVAGTLKPSTMGMGPATEQPGSRLLGAVVEGPGGPWFFKATGPAATITAERDSFLKMLRSVRAKTS